MYMYHVPYGISFRDKYCIDRSYRQLVQLFLWNIDNDTSLHWLLDMSIIAFYFVSNIHKLHLSDLYFFPLIIMRMNYVYFLLFRLLFYLHYGGYIIAYWLTTCNCPKMYFLLFLWYTYLDDVYTYIIIVASKAILPLSTPKKIIHSTQ